jgi:hypothetical protein
MEEKLNNIRQNNVRINSINNGTNVFNINIDIKVKENKFSFLELFKKIINGFKTGLGWLKIF